MGDRSERLRVPPADGTLVVTPGLPDEDLIPSLLTASDVLGTDGAGDQVDGAQRAGHLPALARTGALMASSQMRTSLSEVHRRDPPIQRGMNATAGTKAGRLRG